MILKKCCIFRREYSLRPSNAKAFDLFFFKIEDLESFVVLATTPKEERI